MKKLLLSALLIGQIITTAHANQVPISYPSDERIKMVSYQENNVVPIYGKTFTSTQVVFARDEYVLDIEGGDTSGWMVTHHKSLPNMVFLKPTMLGSDSNMTIVTNKHNYYFHVMSNKDLRVSNDAQTYAIKFKYPVEERRKLNARLKLKQQKRSAQLNQHRNPNDYNWAYSFAGSHRIMPLHVFDDGTFTFFELRKNQPVPAIFAVDDRTGKESVVNTRRQGDYIVVQRLAPQFTLRNGNKAVASVFNKREISHIKRRG
jgi:type IV secretion system protein VirB9